MSHTRPIQNKTLLNNVTPFVIDSPVGVDAPIKDLQEHFANELPWLSKSFNRAEIMSRNNKDGEEVVFPKGWVNENVDEMEMIALDYWDSYSFFAGNDNETIIDFDQFSDNIYQQDVSLYFWFNIEDIKKNNAEFTTESSSNITNLLKVQILDAIGDVTWSGNNEIEIKDIENNPLNVYNAFTFNVTEKQFYYPFKIIRIDMNLSYEYNKC